MEELVHSWCVLHHHDQFLLYHHLPGTLCTVTTGRLCTREGVERGRRRDGRGKEGGMGGGRREGWEGEGGRDGRGKEGGMGGGRREGWEGEGGRDGRGKEGRGSFLPLPSPSRLMHHIFHIVKLALICSVRFRFQGDWYSPEVLPRGN